MYFQMKKDLFQSLQCFYSSVFMKVDVLPLFHVLLLINISDVLGLGIFGY